MVKHVTRRSYKNRASKKRRTIRKLKKTMRRKIQRGGNGSLALVAPGVLVLLVLFEHNPVVKGFLGILSVCADDSQQGGNKRLNQMGGGRLSAALTEFGETIKVADDIPPETKPGLLECIGILKTDNQIDTVITEMNEPGPEDKTVERIMAQNGGGFLTRLVSSVADGKDTAQKHFLENIRPKIDKIKDFFIAKVSHLKDEQKRKCIKDIFSYGFKQVIGQFSSVSSTDIINAMTEQTKIFKAKAAQSLRNFSDKVSSAFSRSPSSAPETGNGEENQVHKITITTGGNIMFADMTKGFAEFTKFEGLLKNKLKAKGWPDDETIWDNAIEAYNNSVNPRRPLQPLGYTIFIFALLSGMITSIEFTNDTKKTAEKVNITNADAFMVRYYDNASRHPYSKFKRELSDIVTTDRTKIITGLGLTIKTDFTKTPDYASFQAKAADEAKDALKAELIAANKKAVAAFDDAVKVRDDANSKKISAQMEVKKSGIFPSKETKLALGNTLAAATTAAEEANNRVKVAQQATVDTARAAMAKGVLATEVVEKN